MLVCFAIMGMGGAPIAEKFEVMWLVEVLKWISYISCALLAIATALVGGLGLYHGILTVFGKDIGTISTPVADSPLMGAPEVRGPGLQAKAGNGNHVADPSS